jgi:hypothetical protein
MGWQWIKFYQFRVMREGTLKDVLDASFNGGAVGRYCELQLVIEDATTLKAKTAAKKAMKEAFPHGEPRHDHGYGLCRPMEVDP